MTIKRKAPKERRIESVNGVPGIRLGRTASGIEWVCYVQGKTPPDIERECRIMERALRALNRKGKPRKRRPARRRAG